MKNVLVSDIMTREPLTVSPDATLLDCAKIMVRKRVGSLLIVQNKKLVGFISQQDILWALVKKNQEDLSKIRAISISPKKLATTRPDSSVEEAIKKMKKLSFERLPVIANGELIGIITIRDILNFNPEIYPELEEFSKIREETEKLSRVKKAKERRNVYEGICEECGAQDLLFRANGMLVCESCKNSM